MPSLALRFQAGVPGRLTALVLFLFLLTQEVSGIGLLVETLDVALFAIALAELGQGFGNLRRAVGNVVGLGVLVFISSVLMGCLLSPDMAVSFGETRTPIWKGMVAVPIAMSLCISRLVRLDWSQEDVAALLLLAMALSGLSLVLWALASYGHYYLATGSLPADPFFHRYKASAALVALPFGMVGMGLFRFPGRPLMALIIVGLAILLFTSGARGAWLGAAASCLYLYLLLRRRFPEALAIRRWHLIALLVILVATGVALVGTPMGTMLIGKLTQGFDTSARAGNGVWGATLDMIRERPWLGYGYGDEIYSRAYNALVQSRPQWFFRESVGPHNAILGHWVAVGVIGLAAIVFLYGAYLVGAWRLVRQYSAMPYSQALVHAGVAAMISSYLVRGQFEIVRWNAFGILMGLTLWLFMVSGRRAAVEGDLPVEALPSESIVPKRLSR